MHKLNITVFHKNIGWRFRNRPENDDVADPSRPCQIVWTLDPDTAREWRFDDPPLVWKPGSGKGFRDLRITDGGAAAVITNDNTGGKRHRYTLKFRHRSTNAADEKDASIQNWPRPHSFHARHGKDLLLIGGAVAVGGLLALLLARPNWRRRDRDDIGYRDD